MIHPCVRDAFFAFTARFEGVVPWMYADILGLVTCAAGVMLPTPESAQRLPWWHSGGIPSTPEEIADEWHIVLGNPDLARLGAKAAERVTVHRLSSAEIASLVDTELTAMVARLATRFDIETWPADAQLALCSMAWAMGAGFHFPRFEAAVRRPDFIGAALECKMREEGNPGIVRRNATNRQLFLNAALVRQEDGPLSAFRDPAAVLS